MSVQSSLGYQVILNLPGGQSQATVTLSKSQVYGISMMVHTLGPEAARRIQLISPLRHRPPHHRRRPIDFAEQVNMSRRVITLVSRSVQPPFYQVLMNFDPRYQTLASLFESHGVDLPASDARYTALFVGPNDAYVVKFISRSYLQGAISAANWLGYDYRTIIRAVYSLGSPMEIA
jgi:hypothetical protein